MAAYWMARCAIRARVVDKRATKVFKGQADGLRVRTLELFDSIGFQHRVYHEGNVAVEANFWVRTPPSIQRIDLTKAGARAKRESDPAGALLQHQSQRVALSQHALESRPSRAVPP